jgi:hypothetical protein
MSITKQHPAFRAATKIQEDYVSRQPNMGKSIIPIWAGFVATEYDTLYEPLVEALEAAESHIAELREAWQRGAIKEHGGQGGTRSNRNADVHMQIRAALTASGRKP